MHSSGGNINGPHQYSNAQNVAQSQQNIYSGAGQSATKDPHHYWRETLGDKKAQQENSWFKDFLLHWPIQMLEQQLQQVASSKVDFVADTSALITDVDFRWLGIRNLRTIYISVLSLLTAIALFLGISLFTKSILGAYCVLLFILSHSFFPGYITFRMRKFILGPTKTQRYADILRKSWMVFEVIYIAITATVFWSISAFNWTLVKEKTLLLLESHKVFRRLFYRVVESLPINKLDFILNHLLNGLLLAGIFYILMVFIVNKRAKAEQKRINRAVDKEYLRPAEIVRKMANEDHGVTQ
ncbi:MAG: hypothetical protein EOM50_16595 [Erysipelotrichia bacterium]|nr:hypothetical protein [Erysipelotrichia bacterium]